MLPAQPSHLFPIGICAWGLEENIPPLYFLVPVLFLSLYKAAPSSDPYFPPSIFLLTALLTVTAWKAQKEQ